MCALRYRADTQVGPYNGIRNDDNTVKMIRHDHELVRFDRGEFAFQFKPLTLDCYTSTAQLHGVVDNLTEQTGSILCNDGHKIRTALSVIVLS